jgi:uncharacterized membrane protein
MLLGVSNGGTAQPVGTVFAAFFICAGIYFLIDIAWVLLLEMRILNWFFDKYDFKRPKLTRGILVPVFFVYAALANSFVVILPALDDAGSGIDNTTNTALRAFLLGWFSYGNLALVQAWSYEGYPLEIVGIMPLSGGVLSCVSSLLTVEICKHL